MKKRLIILSFVTAWLIPWSSTDASYVLKDFVCEADKSLSCFSINNSGNELEDMQKDLEVCNCLETKFNLKIKDSLSPSEIKARNQKIDEGKILASLLELEQNFKATMEPYLLESLLIHPDNPQKAVAQIFDIAKTDELTKAVKSMLETNKDKISPQFYEGVTQAVESYKQIESTNIVNKINDSRKLAKKENFCISYEGFLNSKMIPKSSLFWQEMISDKAFIPEEWDAQILESDINAGRGDIEFKEAKLEFLKMNPTLKVIFQDSHLREVQNILYNGLKQLLVSDKSCFRKKTCRGEFLKEGHSLPNLIKNLYEMPEVRTAINAELFLDLSNQIPRNNSQPLTLAALRFASDNQSVRYSKCGGGIDPSKAGDCAEVLQSYCSDLRTSGDSIVQIQNGEILNKKFKLDETFFAPPEQNNEYLEMNDRACNKTVRIDKTSKKKLTYREYKIEFCKKDSECLAKSDIEVYKHYMSNTKSQNKGWLLNTQTDEEMVFEGMALVKQIQIDDKILQIASNQDSIFNDFNKSSTGLSISDVISNIEKTKISSDSQNEISSGIVATHKEEVTSSNEIFSDIEASDETLPVQDLSLQNLGTFENQAYLSAPDQFLAKVEEGSSKKEEESNKENSSLNSAVERSIKEVVEVGDSTLEERIKGLEKLLAEKDLSTKSYQKMINQLLEQRSLAQTAPEEKPINEPKLSANKTERKVVQAKSSVQNIPRLNKDQQSTQINETSESQQDTFTSGGSSRAPASLAPTSTRQSFTANSKRVNNVLLTKYGIVVKDNPGSTSAVSVAEEADGSKFSGVKSIAEAADVPLQVSVRDFEQIKTNNLGALEALYTKELKGINDQVVKVLVSTNSSEEVLEFYAIKEEGRVVFQPIRKNKLIDLQNVLHR